MLAIRFTQMARLVRAICVNHPSTVHPERKPKGLKSKGWVEAG